MNHKTTIKYCAFNLILREHYLCTSKLSLAKHINTSVDTIRRREALNNDFIINNWHIAVDIEVHKQPKRNSSGFM